MNKTLLTLAFLATISFGRAQTDTLAIDTSWKTLYRAVPEKINDLVHTKLDAKFDYNKSQLIGKAWLTLQPHFDPVNTLVLDAKGMDIKQVALVKSSGIKRSNTNTTAGYSPSPLIRLISGMKSIRYSLTTSRSPMI